MQHLPDGRRREINEAATRESSQKVAGRPIEGTLDRRRSGLASSVRCHPAILVSDQEGKKRASGEAPLPAAQQSIRPNGPGPAGCGDSW